MDKIDTQVEERLIQQRMEKVISDLAPDSVITASDMACRIGFRKCKENLEKVGQHMRNMKNLEKYESPRRRGPGSGYSYKVNRLDAPPPPPPGHQAAALPKVFDKKVMADEGSDNHMVNGNSIIHNTNSGSSSSSSSSGYSCRGPGFSDEALERFAERLRQCRLNFGK